MGVALPSLIGRENVTSKTHSEHSSTNGGDYLLSNAERRLFDEYKAGSIDLRELTKRYPEHELHEWNRYWLAMTLARIFSWRPVARRSND